MGVVTAQCVSVHRTDEFCMGIASSSVMNAYGFWEVYRVDKCEMVFEDKEPGEVWSVQFDCQCLTEESARQHVRDMNMKQKTGTGEALSALVLGLADNELGRKLYRRTIDDFCFHDDWMMDRTYHFGVINEQLFLAKAQEMGKTVINTGPLKIVDPHAKPRRKLAPPSEQILGHKDDNTDWVKFFLRC